MQKRRLFIAIPLSESAARSVKKIVNELERKFEHFSDTKIRFMRESDSDRHPDQHGHPYTYGHCHIHRDSEFNPDFYRYNRRGSHAVLYDTVGLVRCRRRAVLLS